MLGLTQLPLIALAAASRSPGEYTNQWAVHIEAGDAAADAVATAHGFENLGQVSTLLWCC